MESLTCKTARDTAAEMRGQQSIKQKQVGIKGETQNFKIKSPPSDELGTNKTEGEYWLNFF